MKKKSPWRVLVILGIPAAAIAAAILLYRSTWIQVQSRSPQEAFLHGTIGTEVVPLPVFKILPDLFPDQFQPGGPAGGDWIQQFGFIRGSADVNEGLPLGFTVSNYLPQSGSPSPIPFVGFSCSACHTSLLKRSDDDPGTVVYGMGSTSVDFFGWADALRTAILDRRRLTMRTIEDNYEGKFGKQLGMFQKITIRLWLGGIRDALEDTLPKYDAPFGGKDLRDSALMPIGPGRSQAFKSLVQIALNRPGATDRAYSKLPGIYEQRIKEHAQYDGSAKNFVLRSALAALGSGATLETLALPEVLDNIRKASEYSLDLKGPKFTEIFKDVPLDPGRAARGAEVYKQFCTDCHGYAGPDGSWVHGKRDGEIIPAAEIGTDPERVRFRYYDVIGKAMYDFFPDDHPLNPQGDDLRQEGAIGFMNAPIQAAFTRAPYLHNGSVPTMAELINLKPRPAVFFRGSNLYDTGDMGLQTPEQPDARRYYRFDTSDKGNSNKGHDYPWIYRGPGWNEEALKDLLEYLKTL